MLITRKDLKSMLIRVSVNGPNTTVLLIVQIGPKDIEINRG